MKCDDYALLEKLLIYVREQMKLFDILSREEFVEKPVRASTRNDRDRERERVG